MKACRRNLIQSPHSRSGFTLIELLVVISIIATLMALLLPAIQNARSAARRTQCLNNIRNVTIAAMTFASANADRLPPSGYYVDHDDIPPDEDPGPFLNWDVPGYSWVVPLLPYLDAQGIHDRWDIHAEHAANSDLNDISLPVLACPEDDSAFEKSGGLSYVANGGFGDHTTRNENGTFAHWYASEPADWDGDGLINRYTYEPRSGDLPNRRDVDDREVTRGTGVFWLVWESLEDLFPNRSAVLGRIYDGASNTLMFGENIHAGELGWGHPRVSNCLFFFPFETGDSASPCTKPNNTNFANAPEYIIRVDISSQGIATPDPHCARFPAYPNESRAGPNQNQMNLFDGAPLLNSNHPGLVVVSFCDGSARTLSDSVDHTIYTWLMTPEGSRQRTVLGAAGFNAEGPLNATDF